jgi:hypothetical protein
VNLAEFFDHWYRNSGDSTNTEADPEIRARG